MSRIRRAAVRSVLPITVFVVVTTFHFVELGLFPEPVVKRCRDGNLLRFFRGDSARCPAGTARVPRS
jgi:hypothetical protein